MTGTVTEDRDLRAAVGQPQILGHPKAAAMLAASASSTQIFRLNSPLFAIGKHDPLVHDSLDGALTDGGTFATGNYRFRYCRTPHLPHGWDAGVLFEETQKTLFCSDLFHQIGDVEPLTSADIVGRSHQALKEYQAGILAEYMPYTPLTAVNLKKLADLKPKTLAIMHGSSFTGDCARALNDFDVVLREVFGPRK